MAILTSTRAANIIAYPQVPNNRGDFGSAPNKAIDNFTIEGDQDGDNLFVGIPLPLNARISSIVLANGAGGTSAALDVGLGYLKNGAFVVDDDDAISAAIDVSTASTPREILTLTTLGAKVSSLLTNTFPEDISSAYLVFTADVIVNNTNFVVSVEYIVD